MTVDGSLSVGSVGSARRLSRGVGMQPVGPYRFTHMLGGSVVGKAWAAIDSQGRFATIAVLESAVAADPRWREAFAAIADSLSMQPGAQAYVYADFSATAPWVAYSAEAGPGAETLLRALGAEYHPIATDTRTEPPVSGVPQAGATPPQPVSGIPQPTSGPPVMPWAVQAGPVSGVPVSGQPVSAEPAAAGPHSPAQTVPSSAGAVVHSPFGDQARRIQPSEPPKRRTRFWIFATALILVAALAGGATAWVLSDGEAEAPQATPTSASTTFPTAAAVDPSFKPWAQAAPYSPEERALAVAAPSLVFVEAVFTGYVRNARTNALLRTSPITFTRRCSAFVVTPNGHALTSSSCVKPSEENARQIALDAVARMLVREKTLGDGEVADYVRTNLSKVRFTGVDVGTEPASEVYGQLNDAKGNLTTEPAIPAQVVRALPTEAGNTALIKFARENLPVVELNPSAALAEGSSLLVLGFATTDTDFRTATYRPQSKLVTVTGTGRRGSVSIYRINEDIGTASHGGIALDPSGRVAGMIDQDQARPDRANRVVLPTSTLAGLLGEAGAGNALGEQDKLYRSGLDAYFAGEHAAAISRLETVAQNAPANLLAQAYRQNAVERQQNEGVRPSRSVWPVVLLASLGAALLAGLIVLVVGLTRRRRA
ncbi:trypsin-like peptidase domain-containing protein [Micromonospora sp. DT62]|uniref:trypsin-like peptidase domain-containing protein n=1 Tax=Micromonospora sp. DT62 TaxID=3416521 RepID=UPI003CEB1680